MADNPKTIALVGVALGLASYVCKQAIEWLERKKTGLESELESFQSSSQHHATQLGQLSVQQQLGIVQHQTTPTPNFQTLVVQDTMALKHAEALSRGDSEGLSRLIEKLVFRSAAFRKELETLSAGSGANKVALGSPSKSPDWTDAAQVKLAIVSTAIGGLPVLFFGDKVITAGKEQLKLLDLLMRVARWAAWILAGLGVGLVTYGIVQGVKVGGTFE
jgi:hypothetical protein